MELVFCLIIARVISYDHQDSTSLTEILFNMDYLV